jgi:hypothetical protein
MAKKKPHAPEQISMFTAELEKQTDRGAAIIAAAVLEDLLAAVVQRRLIELSGKRTEALFGRMAPLSTFSAKIEMGFALGIYGDDGRIHLDTIRDVRNKFAHKFESLSFEHHDIAALLKKRIKPKLFNPDNVRLSFMATFTIMAALLYAETAFDIRIKSVAEEHPDQFAELYLTLHELGQRTQAAHPPNPNQPNSARPTRK